MRKINEIIIHCTQTPEYVPVSVELIRKWHRARGWSDIGYHYVIHETGTIEACRPERQVGAHCYGHNMESIGICYVGGIDVDGTAKDTRTDEQKAALLSLLKSLCSTYNIVNICSHSDYNSNKDCPSFDAKSEYAHLL